MTLTVADLVDELIKANEMSAQWESLSVLAMETLHEACNQLERERITNDLAVESIVALVDELDEARDIARTLLRLASAADVVDDMLFSNDEDDKARASANYMDELDAVPEWLFRMIVGTDNPFK